MDDQATANKHSAEDERLMRAALSLAAAAHTPFGALVVQDDRIIAEGYNEGGQTNDPTAHGEMVALRRGIATHGAAALEGAVLYTTGEPCAMCMGAILWSKIGRLVYAASIENLRQRLGQIEITCGEIAARAPFAKIEIAGGVLESEALSLCDRVLQEAENG